MSTKLNSYFERGMTKFFPNTYSFLVKKGLYVESRWQHMTSLEYLKDNHPDRPFFVNFLDKVNAIRLLEIGAGSQHEVKMLSDRGKLSEISYTIMDINKFWLNEGKKKMPEVNFQYGSINKIPFSENQFDIVYCRHVIEHQPYYEKPLRELMRISNDWVFLNIFRWSLQDDVIRRMKYYSNAYSISKLLNFCGEISFDMIPFIILKAGRLSPGNNISEKDPSFVRRTRDHMIILMRKSKPIKRDIIKEISEITECQMLLDIPDLN